MGDIRYNRHYQRLEDAADPVAEIRSFGDEEVIMALAAASREGDEYLANVLATEAMNRVRRATTATAHLGEGLVAIDDTCRVTLLNRAAEQILGYTQEDLVGEDFHDQVHFQDERGEPIPRERCALFRAIVTGKPESRRDRGDAFTRNDGTPFPVSYTAAPVLREGEVVGAVAVFRDLTPEREEEIRTRRLAYVVEATADAVITADLDRKITHWNPAAERLFGWKAEEVIGRDIDILMPPGYEENANRLRKEAIMSGEPLRFESVRVSKDGVKVPVEVTLAPLRGHLGEALGMSAILRDITDRLRAETALRESEDRFRRLFEATPLPTFLLDPKTLRFLDANEAAVEKYGWTREEWLGMTAEDIRPEEDVPRFREYIRNHKEGIERSREWRHHTKDGRLIHVEKTSRRMKLGGRTVLLMEVADITERKKAQEALRESKEALNTALEYLPTPTVVMDPDGVVTLWNREAEEAFGWSEEEVEDQRLPIIPPEREAEFQRLLGAMHRGEVVRSEETLRRRKNGELVRVKVSLAPVENADGTLRCILATFEGVERIVEEDEDQEADPAT